MNPIFLRLLLVAGLIALAVLGYSLVNRLILHRAGKNRLGLDDYNPGKPGILYFTMPGCIPCQTTQRPALAHLQKITYGEVQVIQVDTVEHPDLAESWGVLSVPTTFVIDSMGEPRRVNHGVALAEKLLEQLEQVEGRAFAEPQVGSKTKFLKTPSAGRDKF
jgi:thiol-disulfide isomerase/thioredoxin